MHVALAQSRGGDSDEAALLAEFLKRCCSHISHAALEPANELIRQGAKRTLVGHATLHAFGDGLGAFPVILHQRVAVGARLHRAPRTHPAIRLKRPALVKNGFSARLFRASTKAPDHHALLPPRT